MHKLVNYLKESREELKKVHWPTRQETLRSTAIVIAMSIGLAVFLGALDYLFTYLFNIIP